MRAYLKARFRGWVKCGSVVLNGQDKTVGVKPVSKVKVLGSCAVRVLSKQAKVWCFVRVQGAGL